jgi:hypothetical protein
MELTKQQSNVMAALKQGNEALKKAQQEVRSAGCASHKPMFQQQPGAATATAMCVGWAAQQGRLLQLLRTTWSTITVNRTERHAAIAATACASLHSQHRCCRAFHLTMVYTYLPFGCTDMITAS